MSPRLVGVRLSRVVCEPQAKEVADDLRSMREQMNLLTLEVIGE